MEDKGVGLPEMGSWGPRGRAMLNCCLAGMLADCPALPSSNIISSASAA